MFLPTAEEYIRLLNVKDPSHFSFLNDYRFVQNSAGQVAPFHTSPNALLFRARKDGKEYVVRVFLTGDAEFFNRYDIRAHYLSSLPLSWKLPFEYFDQEIKFETNHLPVLVMEWSEGVNLNQYLDQVARLPQKLLALQEGFVRLSRSLEENGIAHGDLNFRHVMIGGAERGPIIGLVDYDGMYVPDLIGRKSMDAGTAGFQHPKRLATDFSETLDRFSIWIIIAALEAIRLDPELWLQPAKTGFAKDRNLLFTMRDLTTPENSKLIRKLRELKEPSVQYYLDQILYFCQSGDLNLISKPELYRKGMRSALPERREPAVIKPAEDQYSIEIKSSPAGRDILVEGQKRGITPLTLQLRSKEMGHVEIVHDKNRIPVPVNTNRSVYEIDLQRKEPDSNEILAFEADRYLVQKGERITLNWKVKGDGPIFISGIGEVAEKTGKKKLVLNQTTHYVLTAGSQVKSLAVEVKPPTRQRRFQAAAYKRSWREAMGWNPRLAKALLIAAIIVVAALFLVPLLQEEKTEAPIVSGSAPLRDSTFTRLRVQAFLDGLYDSYNRRSLPAMTDHYAQNVERYYQSTGLTRDSLTTILRNLFIRPASYSCQPDYTTLRYTAEGSRCRVRITIRETLQANAGSTPEQYNTPIEYQLDGNYHIVSEAGGN